MKFSDLNISIVFVNLGCREDRRAEVEYQLAVHGWEAARQPGIKAEWVPDARGFQNERRYACSLAKRMAIRRGMRTGAEAVLLLEDDLVFHPEFHQRLAQLELPDDWGMFYLGCRHYERPEIPGPGLVKCNLAVDNHAVIVRRSHYWPVMGGLAGSRRNAERDISYSDLKLAQQQHKIPAYAAFPNLVWQSSSWSDTSNRVLTAYDAEGCQVEQAEMLLEVTAEMERRFPRSGPGGISPLGSTGCGQLQKADGNQSPAPVVTNPSSRNPHVQELPMESHEPEDVPFVRGPAHFRFRERFPWMACVNLARRPDRRLAAWKQFDRHGLIVARRPAVDARSVRNTRGFESPGVYGCALSHRLVLRDARLRGVESVICLEDDVVMHPEFVPLVEALGIPDDWGILYFGCTHLERPVIISPGVVRVARCFASHAFAVRRAWLPRVIAAFAGAAGAPRGAVRPCDVALTKLAGEVPTYAAFPNLAWQSDGFSDLQGTQRALFHKNGGQDRAHRPWLTALEREMAALITFQNSRYELE